MDGGDHENDSRFEVHELDDEDDNGKEEDGDWETDVDEGLEMEDYVSEFTAHKEPVYCLDLVSVTQDHKASLKKFPEKNVKVVDIKNTALMYVLIF